MSAQFESSEEAPFPFKPGDRVKLKGRPGRTMIVNAYVPFPKNTVECFWWNASEQFFSYTFDAGLLIQATSVGPKAEGEEAEDAGE